MYIYCSHKYGNDKANFYRATKIIHDLQVSDLENTYVSPLHAFSYLGYNEIGTEQELTLCEDLLMMCDKLLVLSETSYGVQREIDLANKCKIPVERLNNETM